MISSVGEVVRWHQQQERVFQRRALTAAVTLRPVPSPSKVAPPAPTADPESVPQGYTCERCCERFSMAAWVLKPWRGG
jgi:hypothetical protein